MKKRLFRTAISVLLIVFGLISTVSAAEAEDTVVSPMYTGISSFALSLEIDSNGVATTFVNCKVTSSSNYGRLTVYLERINDSMSSWEIVKVYQATGQISVYVSGQVTVASGYYYRLKCYATVTDADGIFVGRNTAYSSLKYY